MTIGPDPMTRMEWMSVLFGMMARKGGRKFIRGTFPNRITPGFAGGYSFQEEFCVGRDFSGRDLPAAPPRAVRCTV